ncbi:MAG: DUF3160 domain-containing protein [Capsulimonas sp.]|uniref:DUF3160 domain-containing protein n=1 Tax=Capsulimonas sp. TaxID=2494211 RepID=UPI003264D18D
MIDRYKSRARRGASWMVLSLLVLPIAGADRAFAGAPTFDPAAFGTGVGQAAVSPDGVRIAYQKKTAKGWRIFVGNRDGSHAKAVTSGPGDDVEPSWRPDGGLIAFASSRAGHYDLYAAHPDGTGLRAITHGPGDSRSPQWSPRPFELPYEKDPLRQTVTPRSKANLAPSDLKLLEMLAKDSTDWQAYKYRFDAYKTARYYKLLFVSGQGDKRQIATVREDGRQLMTLSTGIPGAHLNPCWERTTSHIGFVVRRGDTSSIYSADYPVTRDLNDGEGTIKFGVDQKALRQSMRRVGVVNGAAQLAWTPSGEYLAAASGGSLRLFSLPGLKLPPRTYPAGTVAPYGFSWMSDARTALLTVADGGGTHLRPVTCNEPLLDIVNLTDFDRLKPADRTYLTQNSFVASGYPQRQMFGVYEETDYANLPIFVTTDSLLHLHHLVFDYLLRDVETGHLAPETIALVDHYLRGSLDQAKASSDQNVIANAKANAAFFAVAARLAMGSVHTGENAATPPAPDDPMAADRAANRKRQDLKDKATLDKWTAPLKQTLASLPPDVTELVNQEIALISAHAGGAISPIFGGELSVGEGEPPVNSKLDYSDFIPRGHYTRSEVLRRYFLVSHWLSAGAFRRTPELTQRALLLLSATDAPTMARWQKIEDTVHQFAGSADDQDLTAYMAVAKDVYGSAPTTADIADAAKSAVFAARVAQLPAPKIAPIAGPSFRFLPAPSTPDAEIMQQMVYDGLPPDVGTIERPRYFALGLDVMSVLGSDRAHSLLETMTFQGSFFDFNLKETEYANYDAQYQAQREKFTAWTEADWARSLYTRTLYALLPLLKETGAPSKFAFTQSPAWTDKNLNAALGTWAELKHDVLPKQPVATELGGEGGISESVAPVQPVGFVEPAPEVYRRLGMLVDAERAALQSQNYLTPASAQRLDTLGSLLTMVQSLCRKQETGAALTAHEIEQLRFYGAYQEHLALVTAEGGETGSTEGNDMAIVADVSSAFSTKLNQLLALEEGVGRALPIYVAVPYQGHRQIARGAVFTYYEFTHPAEDRLTDEKWRALLDTPQAPKTPAWTKSFISHIDKEQYGQ